MTTTEKVCLVDQHRDDRGLITTLTLRTPILRVQFMQSWELLETEVLVINASPI
jgi:hypothetical protein